jgi:serine/threonine-protein kinase
MADAAGSARVVAAGRAAQPRRVPLWRSTHTDEEARSYLQVRLNLYSKLMFWSFVTLMAFLAMAYRIYAIAPKYSEVVFGGAAVMLGIMALVWRLLIVRRQLTVEGLQRVDLAYAITIGLAFGASAALQFDLPSAGYTSLIFTCFTVFTRALLVPSSTRRTAIIASVTFVPVVAAGVYLAITTDQDLPGPAYAGGGFMICAIGVLIASTGSGIIYDLRKKVTEAMQLGQYTLGRRIGGGGMGEVYEARHKLLRRPTAVKLLRPDRVGGADNLDRFEKEVQAMSHLTHPNTVAVFDYGRNPEGVLYYAMEYLDGIDLEHLVQREGPQPAARVIHILRQVAGALQEAHDVPIIHRDIKPGNIILCVRGGMPDVAKVVDFGLVKELARESTASTQVIVGTPHYIAPEAVTDPAHIGPAVDLYALGAVGYFLLTGQRVFNGKTHVDICIQHVTQAPRSFAEVTTRTVPPALEALIMKCLSKQPASRHASATELAEGLGALPDPGDWSRDQARTWWRAFHAKAASAPSTDLATQTMTVALAQRE